MYEDAKGTSREPTMQWVVEMLYPTLLRSYSIVLVDIHV
jgi:hypothetical protein